MLRDEQARILENYEILEEGPRDFASGKGYELIAKGSYRGRSAVLRQCVVANAEHVWLLSAFTTDAEPSGTFGLIEEVLKTVEFSAE